MGWQFPPFYGKSVEFYTKEIKKAEDKIAELELKIKVCKEEIAKING